MSCWTTAAVAAALVSWSPPVWAQTDYRNLDRGRPTLVADAHPVELFAFELGLPYRAVLQRGAVRGALAGELAFGVAPGAALAVHVGNEEPAGASLFINALNESRSLPAVAMQFDAALPDDDHGGAAAEVTLLATRSYGLQRVHVNASVGRGWWYGVAVDRLLFRHSVMLVGEVHARRDSSAAPVAVNAGLGVRWQVSPRLIVDGGVSRRIGPAGPDVAFTLGSSTTFGLSGLRRAASTQREQFHYPGRFNWQFLRRYPEAARLFNAFDYGHAILYERLLTLTDSGDASRTLAGDYAYLTTDLLVRPPRFAVVEEAIAPRYAREFRRAIMMFDWAHVLHRQIYDAYASERLSDAEKRALVERLTDFYLANTELAFAPRPKSMALMDEQYYSKVFRERYVAFNGLIWAYHWLQVGLYDPLIAGTSAGERRAGVRAAVARFQDMLRDAPSRMPADMPMTAAVSPLFAERHPRAAAIFDNLHMMHDIISDILASDRVPRDQKRAEIDAALDELRHPTRHVLAAPHQNH